jgi:hypothetical protein
LIAILGAIALFLFNALGKLNTANQQVASLNNTLSPVSSITNFLGGLISNIFTKQPTIKQADPSMFSSINQFTPFTSAYVNTETKSASDIDYDPLTNAFFTIGGPAY